MVELPHISNPFKRKEKEFSDEELLEEIEKETGIRAPSGAKPFPPPPSLQRPVSQIPMPSQQAAKPMDFEEPKMMAKQEMARLPLFMRIEEYDKILAEVGEISDSLKVMDEILENLSKLEEQQSAQTRRWKSQLEATKSQVKQLLIHMPETGKLKEIVQIKKQQQRTDSIKKELGGLGSELKRAAKPSVEVERMQSELTAMKSGMQDEMRKLQEQVRSMAEIVKQSAQQKAQQQQPPRLEFRKTDEKKPW